MSYTVTKRDGTQVPFDMDKITTAIAKSFASLGNIPDESILQLLALRVTADFKNRVRDDTISVEDIQDSAERILSLAGYADAAKAYILYRKQREHVRALQESAAGYASLTRSYLEQPDQAGRQESDSVYSLGGLILSNSGEVTRHYWLNSIIDEQAARAHREGWLYIHDLDMLAPGSAGWDLRALIEQGFHVQGQIQSRPPRHLEALCAQLVNFITTMQNEWSGAQSISHFDTCLAPFVKKDELTPEQIRSALETLIFGLNTPSRWGTQPPFSSLVFDMQVPKSWKNEIADPDTGLTYGDCEAEMAMIRQQFFSVMEEGDSQERGFPFPIPVIRIHTESDIELEVFACAAKYGTPTFARNDEPMEGFFSWEPGKCSLGAVTLNLPKIAWSSHSEEDFWKQLEQVCTLAARILETRCQVLRRFFDNGLYPCTRGYLGSLDQGYCAIGVIGLNESVLNAPFLKKDLTDPEAQEFASRVLCRLREFTDARDHFVLMATPAEAVSQRLAELDARTCPGILTAGTQEAPYYTNSSQLAVSATDDLFRAISLQEQLQKYFNGGSFFSIPYDRYLEPEQIRLLEEKIRTGTSLPVFAFSPVWSVCPDHGWQFGKSAFCCECGQPAEIWVRVSGYYRPLCQVNKAKKQEYLDRKAYQV